MTTQSFRRRLPEPRVWSRVLLGLGVAVSAALVAVASAPASPSAKTRVTVIGDSITASFDYVPAARRYLGKGLDLRSDAVVCRRLVAASCVFQGSTPATALQVIDAHEQTLGPVVVVNVGYNDWAAVYDVDRVMRALTAAGVQTAIWVTLARDDVQLRADERADSERCAPLEEASRRRRLERLQPWQAVVSRGRPAPHADGRDGPRAAPASSRPRRRVGLVACGVPSVLHRGVELLTKFPLAARVSGWTTSGDLSTGRPRAGITSERMFCSPCTGGVRPSLAFPLDAAAPDGLTPAS